MADNTDNAIGNVIDNVIEDLKRILHQVGPENIWRPVITPDNQLLADGTGDENDGIIHAINRLNFRNKSVIDLGCNLGYNCFAVKKAGAARVFGVDIDERLIHGCNILKNLYNLKDIEFQAVDITTLNDSFTFDVGMMIDFIGKNSVSTGMLLKFLDILESVSRREMILSIRPVYRIDKHLGSDRQGLIEKYSKQYVHGGCFYGMDYVTDRFSKEWLIDMLPSAGSEGGDGKETVLLRRKSQ